MNTNLFPGGSLRAGYVIFYLFLLLASSNVSLAQVTYVAGPAGSGNFGSRITVLTNGNYVVTDPDWGNGGVTNIGAVYLYNGATHALISKVTGSKANDQVGYLGAVALDNGNFVISSPFWGNGSEGVAGAVTWGNGITGVSGVVSAANSLIGSKAGDLVGAGYIWPLNNGNYVVVSAEWDNAAIKDAGAVTWGNGLTGVTGVVSASNSLVGSQTGDKVGVDYIRVLTNGNYVVRSSYWNNASVQDAGAATWCSGTTGMTGVVSISNSLVGSQANDRVGQRVTALSNGNYVVASTYWSNGSLQQAGAATWGNGATGVKGEVSVSNSLVGSSAFDYVGINITALTNGNYVASCASWDNAGVKDAGAVTWANGTTGVAGLIDVTNSLLGSKEGDYVGRIVTALVNGNYVVGSSAWGNASAINAGAITWGNGATGIQGFVGVTNSLVGSSPDDGVGSGITALTNGNYVVASASWSNASVLDVGAVTFLNGTAPTIGVVSTSNSLVGSLEGDMVGSFWVTALTNGNYVVRSPEWNNAGVQDAGAVTWGSGITGIIGVVSASNSLVGSTESDRIGFSGGVTALSNGNYVVVSGYWDNGSDTDAGAVTWGDGASGINGAVSVSNSLVGSAAHNFIGSITSFSNGGYVLHKVDWHNGDMYRAGVVTYLLGQAGVSGIGKSCISIPGTVTNGGFYFYTEYNSVYDYLLIGYPSGNYYVIHYNGSGLANDNSEVTETIDNNPVTYLNDCGEIGVVAPSGEATSVAGSVKMKVYVAQSAPFADQRYVRRYYDVNPAANANTATGRVTLFYDQPDFDNFNANRGSSPALPTGPLDSDGIQNFRITQHHGTSTTGTPGSYTGWTGAGPAIVLINPEDGDIVWNNVDKRWEVSFDVTGFSGFFAHSDVNGAALPVRLVSFTAQKSEGNALLKWKTTSEINASHFEIERSIDGKKYKAIASVGSTGSEDGGSTYSFTDKEFTSFTQITYYRLRSVDIDGSYAFSNIESLQPDETLSLNYIYPNPAKTGASVFVKSGAKASNVKVLDLKGREIGVKVTHRAVTGFTINQLPQGMYLVKFDTEHGPETRKLIVE